MIIRQSYTIRSTRCRQIDQRTCSISYRKSITMLLQAVAAKLTSELGQRRRRPRRRQQRRQAQVAAGSMRLNSVARGSYPTGKSASV